MTDWLCAQSVGLTTHLLQGTVHLIFKLGQAHLGAVKVKTNSPTFLFYCLCRLLISLWRIKNFFGPNHPISLLIFYMLQ